MIGCTAIAIDVLLVLAWLGCRIKAKIDDTFRGFR